MSTSFESFEKAFRGGINGLRRTCECGVEYWDSYNSGYDWDEGEREALEDDPTKIPVSYAVGIIEFEGRTYVDACTCWHERAKRIASWIDSHAEAIAEYLSLEKKRKQNEADRSPVVK